MERFAFVKFELKHVFTVLCLKMFVLPKCWKCMMQLVILWVFNFLLKLCYSCPFTQIIYIYIYIYSYIIHIQFQLINLIEDLLGSGNNRYQDPETGWHIIHTKLPCLKWKLHGKTELWINVAILVFNSFVFLSLKMFLTFIRKV